MNLALDFGGYYLHTDGKYEVNDQTQEVSSEAGLRRNSFTLRGGLGINIRPTYWLEIRAIPTMYYNINSLNRGSDLRNNLFNYGISIGGIWLFSWQTRKD